MKTEVNPNIIIDRRPIWIVSMDRMRRELILAIIFSIFVFLLGWELPSDISDQGYRTLCLFFLCVSLWATNLIPLSITSLLAIAGIPLLGIMGYDPNLVTETGQSSLMFMYAGAPCVIKLFCIILLGYFIKKANV